MTTADKPICATCGKPQRNQMQASFTQWIFDHESCSCGLVPQSFSAQSESADQFCAKCGRPTRESRDGSMTQWIFRTVSCSCEQVETQPIEVAPVQFEFPDEEALELDPKYFPVARYKPLKELGAGANGTVYLCRDTLLNTHVAVKTLHALSNEQFMLFQREAMATSKLNHPAILRLLDFGPTEGGAPYMVLDYFKSITLSDYIEENGVLEPGALKVVCMQVASALERAHRMGIYHRDLKPSNILVSSNSGDLTVKVIDFGTAVLNFTDAVPALRDNALVGTPAYMAPDMAAGLPFDARSEVYSFGCVMFECLTGRAVFEGESAIELLSHHMNTEAPSLWDAGFEYDEVVVYLVARCLEKNPDERFQSMLELMEALAKIETNSQLVNATEAELQAIVKPKRVKVSLIFVPLVVVLAIGVLYFAFNMIVLKDEEVADAAAPVNFSLVKKYQKPDFPGAFGDAQLKQAAGRRFTKLDLTDTLVTAKGLKYIANEPIESLWLENTAALDVKAAAPTLRKFRDMTALSLAGKGLASADLNELRGLRLTKLSLGRNPGIADDAIPIIVELFPDLRSLSIGNTSVTGVGVSKLAALKNLRSVDLSRLKLDDAGLEALAAMPLLSIEFYMSNVTDEGLRILAKSRTLRELKLLGATGVTQKGVDELKKTHPGFRVVIDNADTRHLGL